jgi:hypothetical protein
VCACVCVCAAHAYAYACLPACTCSVLVCTVASRARLRVRYAAFFAKFDAQAADGKLSKAKCVVNATDCLLEVYTRSRIYGQSYIYI